MTISARSWSGKGGARRPRSNHGGRSEAAQRMAEMPDILRALCEEHRYQVRIVNLLEKQVALLNQRKQPDYEVMHGVMRYMTNYPDRFHHPKEDLVFRKVVERDPSSSPQVDHLQGDHGHILAQGAELLAIIDRCRADPKKAETFLLRKSAHKYIGRLRRHWDAEELRFFPHAQRVLRPEDWAEIDAGMQPILDPVFGETDPGEFAALRRHAGAGQGGVGDRAVRTGWVEAIAVLESFSALVAGATTAGAKLSQHNLAVLNMNAALLRDLRRARRLGRRVGLIRDACARNVSMARDIRRQLSEVLSEAIRAARRPFQEEGAYAAKLSEVLRWLARPARRPSAAGASSVE